MSDSNYGFEPTLDGLNTINSDSSTITDIICDTIQINVSGTAPTMAPLNNSTNIATTAFVTTATSGFMDLISIQTAPGAKTFSNANTVISGNLITNNIVSTSATTDINIGVALTTGDIKLGNSGVATNVALNWGGSSNSGQLLFQGGSFNLASTGVFTASSGSGNNADLFIGQGGGTLNLATLSARTGTININTGSTSTATVNISSGTNANAPIIIGSSGSTTQTATHNGISTFTKIPSCAVAPTSANHLCNYTYVNSVSASPLGGANVWTGTNAFNTNLPTSTLTPSTGTELTTKTYVDSAITSGSILGTANAFTNTNTFNSFLPTSTVTPTTGTELTTKTYVDSVSGSILGTANAFTNTNTFDSFLPTSTVTPTTAAQLTTKTYVDGAITTAATAFAKLGSANAFTSTNTFNTNLPTSTLTPSSGTQLTTKTYVDSVSGTGLLSSNNSWTGTNTFTNTHNINTTGGATTTIGNGSASLPIVNIDGTVNINSTTVRNTNIGNATATTTVTGQFTCLGNTQFGDSSADFIVPNGTMTKPWIIGTYASVPSFSLASITPVTTYLGGTIQTSVSYGNVPTGSFKYLMVSIPPYSASGGIALTAGTYMFWIGINFEDSSAFSMTDLRLGMSNVSTLSAASTEAQFIAALPNLTCYFHKTDAADAVASDSEQRVLSGCFNITAATTMYPFYSANHTVTVDLITSDVVIVKIGGP